MDAFIYSKVCYTAKRQLSSTSSILHIIHPQPLYTITTSDGMFLDSTPGQGCSFLVLLCCMYALICTYHSVMDYFVQDLN